MSECLYVEYFLNSIEGQEFIKEMNEILKDLEWKADGIR